MCDYSLEHVESRAAKVGDKLIAGRFVNSITRGFAGADDPSVAVCLLPGTEVAFDGDVICEPAFGFFPARKLRERVARFRQVDLDQVAVHHDALEFPSGQIVKISRLCEGQTLTVLQLPVTTATTEAKARPVTPPEPTLQPEQVPLFTRF
jgi:hypothetical protein